MRGDVVVKYELCMYMYIRFVLLDNIVEPCCECKQA